MEEGKPCKRGLPLVGVTVMYVLPLQAATEDDPLHHEGGTMEAKGKKIKPIQKLTFFPFPRFPPRGSPLLPSQP